MKKYIFLVILFFGCRQNVSSEEEAGRIFLEREGCPSQYCMAIFCDSLTKKEFYAMYRGGMMFTGRTCR